MKGQAAVEYLMTYGWALLALVIVVGVLLTSGLLSPSYLVAEECSFGNNFPCNFAIYNDGGSTKLGMDIFNGYPYKVKIIEINIQTTDGLQSFSGFATNVELDSGEHTSPPFEATLSGPEVKEGDVKKFTGNITYVSCASELGPTCSTSEHIISGRVVGKIIPQ